MAKTKNRPAPQADATDAPEPEAEATHTSADGTVWVTTEATAADSPAAEQE